MIHRQVRLTWLIAVFLLSTFSVYSECPGTSVFVDAVDLKCNGDNSGKIVLSRTFISLETPYQYSINGGTFKTDSVFSNLSKGIYQIRVKNRLGCDSLLAPVTINEPDSLLVTTGTTPADCGNDGVAFVSATGGTAPYIYEWNTSPAVFSDELRNIAPGNYTVKVKDQNNCTLSTTQAVTGQTPLTVSATPNSATVDFGGEVIINTSTNRPGNSFTYQWFPDAYLSCSNCASPTIQPIFNQNYVVIVTDVSSGCVATDTIFITVNGTVNLFVPNAFSPNGDGNNDIFKIYGLGILTSNLKVFDERGFTVFESSSVNDGWDGTIQNIKAEPGLYFYNVLVSFIDGSSQQKNGQLVLIR